MPPDENAIAVKVQRAWPRASAYKLHVGGGLYVYVTPQGSKLWRLKYRIDGRERTLSIGVYPKVSCKAALAARDDARAQLKRGIDPSETKRRLTQAEHKSLSGKATFRTDLADDGALTIETDTKIIRLTPAQTSVLREVLNSPWVSERKLGKTDADK